MNPFLAARKDWFIYALRRRSVAMFGEEAIPLFDYYQEGQHRDGSFCLLVPGDPITIMVAPEKNEKTTTDKQIH